MENFLEKNIKDNCKRVFPYLVGGLICLTLAILLIAMDTGVDNVLSIFGKQFSTNTIDDLNSCYYSNITYVTVTAEEIYGTNIVYGDEDNMLANYIYLFKDGYLLTTKISNTEFEKLTEQEYYTFKGELKHMKVESRFTR